MSVGYPTEPSFAPPSFPQQPRGGGGNWILGLLLAGLGVLTLGGVLCVAGIWYVAANVDRWLVGLGREAIVAMIEEAEISEEEKQEVTAQVDRVVAAYKERKIDQADLERVLTGLEDAPVMKVLSLYGLDDLYLTGSDLTEAEIKEGRRLYERALRGVYEGKFSEDALYAALPDQVGFGANFDDEADPEKLREQITLVTNAADKPLTTDDVRESLVKLKVMVDNAGIPDEPFQLDIGDEVKKIVDDLLAGKDAG
jgi:hypothetical protein